MNNLNDVTNFLKSKSINISPNNEWLQECCEFFCQSNQNRNRQDLYKFVYGQWLLADLRDINEPCLPVNLNNLVSTTLTEKYTVQVNEMLDISESSYSQLKKIHKEESTIDSQDEENEEGNRPTWQPKRTRTLRLVITDGIQNISGLEFELINGLEESFIPGFKVLLIGPLECRRGVILLRNQNIQVLGGEIDSLIEQNCLENILTRKLNYQSTVNTLSEDSRVNYSEGSNVRTNTSSSPNDDGFSTNFVTTSRNLPSKDKTVGVVCPVVLNKRCAESPLSLKEALPLKAIKKSDTGGISDLKSRSKNLKTVSEMKNLINEKICGLYLCAASIESISRPKIKNSQWYVTANIVDDLEAESVELCDLFLEEQFGISAVEVLSQKERMMNNPQVRENIDQILKTGIEKIMTMNGYCHLKITMDKDTALLTNITPL